jgi:hypothetical protein
MDTKNVAAAYSLNYSSHISTQSGTPLPAQPTTAIADTRCTGHLLQIDDHAQHRQPTSNGIIVQMPNHSRIQATHTCQINLPDLPTKACEAHLFPNLAHALLSIGLLCDHGCTAIFDKQHVKITYQTPPSSQDIATPSPTYGKFPFNLLRKHSLTHHGAFLLLSIAPTVLTTPQHKLTWSLTCMLPVEAPSHPHGSRPSVMATSPLGQASPQSSSRTNYQNQRLPSKAT